MQASFFADPAWWIEHTERLLTEIGPERRAQAPRGASPPRILLTGSPVLFPDFQLLHLIEEGGAMVADEMCSGTQRLYNPTVIDEPTVGGMLRAAAEKTLMPCTCPCFVGEDLRVDRVLDLARRSGARGVIHHTLRLCQLFDIDVPRLAEALRARGLPLLSVYTEHGGEAAATLKNRVDAFLEMLQQ
jgi:benzoyl-CoA reductase/2-hydroxyglutaryl-CoA dehydratase subunit BcrC/BadD/HgdB